jgi:hypothetical protein
MAKNLEQKLLFGKKYIKNIEQKLNKKIKKVVFAILFFKKYFFKKYFFKKYIYIKNADK